MKTVQASDRRQGRQHSHLGVRLARQLGLDIADYVTPLVRDPSPQVRRELAIALRHSKSPSMPTLWAELALQHDGKDRWYLEALGIACGPTIRRLLCGVAGQSRRRLEHARRTRHHLAQPRPARRPITWSRFCKILQPAEKQQDHYMRAFDFHDGEKKEAALKSLLGL